MQEIFSISKFLLFLNKVWTSPIGEVWKPSWDFSAKVPLILLCFLGITKNHVTRHVMKWQRSRKRPRILVAVPILGVYPSWISILLRVLIFSIWEFLQFPIFPFSIFLIRFLSRDILSNQLILDIVPICNFLFPRFEWTFLKILILCCTRSHGGIILKDPIRIEAREAFIIVPTSGELSKIFRSLNFGGEW